MHARPGGSLPLCRMRLVMNIREMLMAVPQRPTLLVFRAYDLSFPRPLLAYARA